MKIIKEQRCFWSDEASLRIPRGMKEEKENEEKKEVGLKVRVCVSLLARQEKEQRWFATKENKETAQPRLCEDAGGAYGELSSRKRR